MGEPDGIVAYAGVDWWYHNRGHSECQIMRRLAERLPVLWVNSIGMRTPTPSKSDVTLSRYFRKLKSTLHGLRHDDSGMWVLSPLFVPRYTERAVRLNGFLLRVQVRIAFRRIGIRHPAVWITIPTAVDGVGRDWGPVIFNRSDDFSAFPEVDHDLIAGLERRLLAESDHVLYVNHGLMVRENELAAHSDYLGHGVDFHHFAEGAIEPEPTELRELPRPIIGFYGAFDNYTVDLDLLVAVARDNPDGTVLLIGPQQMDLGRITDEPNVVYLGAIPYDRLPAYAARFDVGLMPWLDNEWIKQCNPIKLKEYLASGFPIVSTDFPELAPYRHAVHVGAKAEEFIAEVRLALAEPAETAELRRDLVRSSGWDAVADRVAKLMRLDQ